MMVCIIGILIGVLVLGTGIYYLHQEKHDSESRKIYIIVSVVGALLAVGAAVWLILGYLRSIQATNPEKASFFHRN